MLPECITQELGGMEQWYEQLRPIPVVVKQQFLPCFRKSEIFEYQLTHDCFKY